MAQSTSGTSSRRHANTRDQDVTTAAPTKLVPDTEWEAKEALRQRELEEARARAAQMEKTMRWWSDCTANWREKWSKVRSERNKAREEAKQLRSKLEVALKDSNLYKSERQDLEGQNEQLKKEIEKIHLLLLKHAGQFDGQIFEALGDDPLRDFTFSQIHDSPLKNAVEFQNGITALSATSPTVECDSTATSLLDLEKDSCIEEYILQGAVPRHLNDISEKQSIDFELESLSNGFDSKSDRLSRKDDYEDGQLTQKLSMLQLRLEEATKTLLLEREEKSTLHRNFERLTGEYQDAKVKCEELRAARQEAVRELLTLQDQHQEEVQLIRADLQDEATSREGTDRRLNDLRAELERLQAENAAEWGKRERLETEKLGLERDNKKLRAELRDLSERLERKGRPLTNSDADFRELQQELLEKTKEIADLKHSQNKLKKMVQDKITELAHSVRRAEQYEAEVKKLRTRVEELKRDLAVAEDELDAATNNIRKLQRSNEELQEQVEGFHVQVKHLHFSEEKEDGGEEMAVLDESDCIT